MLDTKAPLKLILTLFQSSAILSLKPKPYLEPGVYILPTTPPPEGGKIGAGGAWGKNKKTLC